MKLFNIFLLAFLIQSAKCYALIELPDSLFKKAEQGDARAQYRLGRRYYEGNGVTKDYTKAVYWYRKAAEQGNTKAQESLGLCYASGDGVSENRTKAVYWYRKAAEQGHVVSQYRLGECYHYGDGVPKDYKKAMYWHRKAAEQGLADSQCTLGYRYYEGDGVPKDYKQAVYWYRKAAEQGFAVAQFRLGNCYHYGEGVPKDLKQAIYWYRKAAEKGDLSAQYKLNEINKNEMSQKKNDVKKQEKTQASSSKSKSSSPSTIIIGPNESSSELPNVIDISIEKAVYIDKKNGVEEKYSLDVPILKIYRSGLVKFGKEGNMDKLMEFDNAYVENRFPNIVMFDKSDSLGFLSIETTLNLIDYNLSYDLDNRIIISLICKKSESSKIMKIVQLVKQGKFLKK